MLYLLRFCVFIGVLCLPLQVSAEIQTTILDSNVDSDTENQVSPISNKSHTLFHRHSNEIRDKLSPNVIFRWPTSSHLTGDFFSLQSRSNIHVIPTASENGITVVLELCRPRLHDCISGNFSADPIDAPSSQALLQQHQSIGYPVTLSPSIEAYFREYQMHDAFYASIAWEQDEQLYTIQFPVAEKQNMLYMALSMVHGEPIQVGQAPAVAEHGEEPVIIIEGSLEEPKPETTEYENCSELEQTQEIENYPNIRVVRNTAFSNEEIAAAALEALQSNARAISF